MYDQIKRNYKLLKKSKLFDARWYLKKYPDVAQAKYDPIEHYLKYGWKEGRNPSNEFHTYEYLKAYDDVKNLGINPLVHFELYGKSEGRTHGVVVKKDTDYNIIKKSKLWNKRYYLKNNPDVKKAKIDPVYHYLKYGWKEGRNPSAVFNTKSYLEANPDARDSGKNPLVYMSYRDSKKNIEFISNDLSGRNYETIKKVDFDTTTIKNIIKSKDVKIVSFDIFDTLLIRPVIKPTDIFYLIHRKLEKLYGIDFIKYRLNAESLLGERNATLQDIYNHIKRTYNLPQKTINIMMAEELRCEKQLLSIRQDIFDVYEFALKQGKKVIAVSDMYLSSDFLKEVLKDKGYKEIQTVYVSNEFQKRKDDCGLYDVVIKKEKTKAIVHVGDNYISDYVNSIKAGLTGIYYPSIKDIVFRNNSIYKDVFVAKDVSPDAFCRILLGYTINKHFNDLNKVADTKRVFNDINDLGQLAIAPFLFYIGLKIATSEDIQKNYKQVLFASRDGYMPKKAYDIISKYYKDLIPSKYMYAGRRAYFSATTDSFIDYIKNKVEIDRGFDYSLEFLLDTYIVDKNIKKRINAKLSKRDLRLNFAKQKDECIEVLSKVSDVLREYYERHRNNVYEYYNASMSNADREIIFDCGYSGSVSDAITKITNKPIDKIYLWQTDKNIQKDIENKTKTILLMNNEQVFATQHLIYEELFSPLEGACIGFNKNKPILEPADFTKTMRNEMYIMQKNIEEYLNDICIQFDDYIQYMYLTDTFALQSMLCFGFVKSPFCESLLLDNIKYSDRAFLSKVPSLAYKVQKHIKKKNVFCGTGFNNPDNMIKMLCVKPIKCPKIGIHIHLYHTHLSSDFLLYLKDFPVKFDLIITHCGRDEKIISNLFNKNTCKNLNRVVIKLTENRGRDVAPWLVGTKEYQSQYDLFCHIHTKNTNHLPFGQQWRAYLLKNLIQKDTVCDIINIFNENKNIGCVFPEIFIPLKQFCINNNIHQQGEFNEQVIINGLLSKMGFEHLLLESDLFFSEGTMLWYRPNVLKKLFDLKLTYKSFPKEPIGVGGSIAHAIERLPALVCRLEGYKPLAYSKYK